MEIKEEALSTIREIEGIESVLLVEKVGLPAGLLGDKNASEISAMTASLWGLGEYYIKKFGNGGLDHITVESNKNKILTFSCNSKILVVSGKKDVITEDLKNKIINTIFKEK
jgi:Uncharacterized distant relative of homeotic protein bithoraxoid